ncbi:hypothetical protein [Streptomyces tauricus]|nr:hypothetical protein [Streptomyces tauricus]MCW8101757.1 hypothetical protein [Streptomyces tauricus]
MVLHADSDQGTLIVADVADRDVVWAAGRGIQGATDHGGVVRSVDGDRS